MKLLWVGTDDSLNTYLKQESEPRPTVEMITAAIAKAEVLVYAGDDDVEQEYSGSYLLTVVGDVGVVSISGVLVSDNKSYNRYYGRISYSEIQQAVRLAVENDKIKTILLDVTSPGGSVTMARETMLAIKAADKVKPVIGFVEMAASGGYWLIAPARKKYIAATGLAGSIGVVTKHTEYSKMMADAGITETILRSGQYKQLMNSAEPLTDVAVKETMRLLDEVYRVFVQDVSTSLGVPYASIDEVAQGREYIGQQAVEAGLFNKVSDFQDVLSALVTNEGEGGSVVHKQGMTYSLASAFAASAAGEEVAVAEVAAEETVAPAGEETEVVVTAEEQLQLDLTAKVELLAASEAALAEAKVEAEAAAILLGSLAKVVAQAVGNISVAMGTDNPIGEDATPDAVLAAYAESVELFAAKFPAGGVAAVGEEAPAPRVVAKSRFEAAKGSCTVAPRKGR